VTPHNAKLRAAFILLTWIVTTQSVRAQDARAQAEALFQEARQLMSAGDYAAACPKLEASQHLDPAVGTLLNLADCYEKNGRTTSAWAEFLHAANEAHKVGDDRRERAARERAIAIEPRLSKLTVTVEPAAALRGLELERDGDAIEHGMWGVALPVDPGEHTIVARAPGRRPWKTVVDVPANQGATTVEIPTLELDLAAQPASTSGALDASLRTSSADSQESPWYGRWYTYVGAGAVVAAGVVIAVLASSSGSASTASKHEPKSGVTVDALRVDP
jgi:tetratricopeptide (TPR) repeat protein